MHLQMMNRRFHKRPDAETLKTHSYFGGIDFPALENGTWSEGTLPYNQTN